MTLQTLPPESALFVSASPASSGEWKTLFVSAPTRRSRLPGLSTSLVLHGVLLIGLLAIPNIGSAPSRVEPAEPHKLSVRFVQLQMPREYRKRESPGATPAAAKAASAQPSATAASTALARSLTPAAQPNREPAKSEVEASAPPREASEHRQFKLPPNVEVQAVKQTLVQMDVPPAVTLKQETPLPTMLLWTEIPEAPRRRFVAPLIRKEAPKVVQSLPVAPAIEAPNKELSPADINVAAMMPVEKPQLVHVPAVASPVSRTGQEPAREIPQIGIANSAQPSAVNLISLPENPLHSASMLVLPPANQIAAADAGTAGSKSGREGGNGTGTGESGKAAAEAGSSTGTGGAGSAAGTQAGQAPGANPGGKSAGDVRASAQPGTGAWTAALGSGTGPTGAKDTAGWSANGSAGVLDAVATPAGVTRIDLPKEGKFGVVVLGSANSASYPESVGALSGKVVYTVYLKVGLRKSWILQYCLPGAGKGSSGSGTPVAAPWPFLIMRPDQLNNTSSDYIILRGMLTEAGQFDKLAMLFPEELEKKELLLSSLKLWAFRPAYRDGVAVPVEVLLIIPNEGE